MLVSELIQYLEKFPADAEVYFPRTTTAGTIKIIRMGRNKQTKGKVCIFSGYPHQNVEVEFPDD